MNYEFKNLSDVELQDKPTENTTVMAFENGVPRQIPAGEFGAKGLVVDLRGYVKDSNGDCIVSDINYDPIYEAFTNGKNVVLIVTGDGGVYYTTFSTMFLHQNGLMISHYEEYDSTTYNFLFTNGSYHTTETASE